MYICSVNKKLQLKIWREKIMDKKYFDEHKERALQSFINTSISNCFEVEKDILDFINMYLESNLPIPDMEDKKISINGNWIKVIDLFNQEKRDNKLKDLLG
jgi:oligoribonuclease (3'-5' exoribonuclease)